MKKKILIASTNPGKIKEIAAFFEVDGFDFVSLLDIDAPESPAEDAGTVQGNALIKAQYYAEKTGMLSLAEDTGLFINALDGWPGAEAAHVAQSSQEKCDDILFRMKDKEDRSAYFLCVMALYDPESQTTFLAEGKCEGTIGETPQFDGPTSFGFSPIFFVPEADMMFSQMTPQQKNLYSHRRQALIQTKYHLERTYSGRHLVVPYGIVIRDGKVLTQLRNDTQRPEFHKKWEFPGGGTDLGECVEEALVREVKEETGYDVKIIAQIPHIRTKTRPTSSQTIQLYLVPYVCKIVGGEESTRAEEVLEIQWHEVHDVPKLDMMDDDTIFFSSIIPQLESLISEYSL